MPHFADSAENPDIQGESPVPPPPRPAAAEPFNLPEFLDGTLALNPQNPFHAQISVLDAASLQRYHLLGSPELWTEQGHSAEILTLSEPEFERIEFIRGYIAHETPPNSNGEYVEDDSLSWPDDPQENMQPPAALSSAANPDAFLEQQDFGSFQIIILAPPPSAPTLPSYLRWMGQADAPVALSVEAQVQAALLCGTTTDSMTSLAWQLG